MGATVPPGWPHDLPPPGTDAFDAKVVGWLLDRGPSELRTSPIRTYPVALATIVQHLVASSIDGVRSAYRTARVELRDHLSPEEIVETQSALEAQGAHLLQVQREVGLVLIALRARTPNDAGTS